jgi:O-antigen/teichoic acid export membrane protein
MGTLGFNNATVKFYPHFRPKGKKSGWPFLITLTSLCGFIIFLLLYSTFSTLIIQQNIVKSPEFANFFYLIIPLTFFQIFFFNLDVYSSQLYDSTVGTFLQEFIQRIFIFLGIIFVGLKIINFQLYTIWYVVSICSSATFLFLYLSITGNFVVKPDFQGFTDIICRRIISISSFGLLNGFSGFAVLQVDRLLLNEFFDSAATGIYSTAFQFGILIIMPARGLAKIATTFISDAFLNRDLGKIYEIYSKSCINQFIIGLFVLLIIWSNETLIFHILPSEYQSGKWVVLLIGLGQLIKMAGGTNDIVIMYSEYYKWITLFLILFLSLNIFFNIIFIPVYGLTGAAIASILAIISHQVMKFIFLNIVYNFQPYNRKYLYASLIGMLSYLIGIVFFSAPNNIYINALIKTMVTSIVYLTSVLFFKLSPEINKTAIQIYSKFKYSAFGIH